MSNEASGQAHTVALTEEAQMPAVTMSRKNGDIYVQLTGSWTTRHAATVNTQMRELEQAGAGRLSIDLAGISNMDTAGAWLVERLVAALDKNGAEVQIYGKRPQFETLLEAVRAGTDLPELQPEQKSGGLLLPFAALGKSVYGFASQFMFAMHILGATIRGAQMKLGRGHAISFNAIIHQMDRVGVGAIPIVMLMSAIVGAIIAQQGAFQMRYFGTEIFVVNLVSILVLREIGVLLTAIMVAGRSGSAITAEVGSMKMREEIDALTVMGLNPIGVLVFPRLVALVITMPLLTVAANAAALCGAILTAWFYSGIEPSAFISRLHDGIDLSTIFSGLIKAPFMGLIIGVIAAMEGLKVEGSAESLGRRVTASVVKAIFCVIVVDGIFAMFYAAIDY